VLHQTQKSGSNLARALHLISISNANAGEIDKDQCFSLLSERYGDQKIGWKDIAFNGQTRFRPRNADNVPARYGPMYRTLLNFENSKPEEQRRRMVSGQTGHVVVHY
jgi:hypothetical protein